MVTRFVIWAGISAARTVIRRTKAVPRSVTDAPGSSRRVALRRRANIRGRTRAPGMAPTSRTSRGDGRAHRRTIPGRRYQVRNRHRPDCNVAVMSRLRDDRPLARPIARLRPIIPRHAPRSSTPRQTALARRHRRPPRHDRCCGLRGRSVRRRPRRAAATAACRAPTRRSRRSFRKSLDGAPPTRVDSGRNCSPGGARPARRARDRRRCGSPGRPGTRARTAATTIAVFEAPDLSADWVHEFYAKGAEAGKNTEGVERSEMDG